MRRARKSLGVALAVGALVVASAAATRAATSTATSTAATSTVATSTAATGRSAALAAANDCSPGATASYPALSSLPSPGALPAGSTEAKILAKGKLVVGVSGDTRLLGARNPLNDGTLEGFDISIAREIAVAIFGPNNVDSHITYKVITAGQRIPLLNDGTVDLVARAMTMNCDRWTNADASKRVAFSQVYLQAKQDVLVRSASPYKSVDGLAKAGASVCAPSGSTSLALIKTINGIKPVEKSIHSDCLAAWQQGEVDAITGDNAILAGFKDQDPHAVLLGLSLEDEPYGLAVRSTAVDFVQFLNAALDKMIASGRWKAIYDANLKPAMGDAAPPTPDTSRPVTWKPPSS